MAPFPVDPSGGDGRGCARLGAGGTPALPGGLPPMTWSHQPDKSAEAFWRQLVVEAGPSVFWSICVYSCPFVVRLHEPSAVFPQVIRPVRGQAPGSQANGSFPKGTGRLSEKSPAGYPPPHHRDDTPRERGRPDRMLSLRLPLSFPAMLQPTALPARTAWARPKQRQGAAAG